MSQRTRGLTLMELLVVVGIVAVLAAIAVPHFLEYQTRSKVSAARSNLRTVEHALLAYQVDNSALPSSVPDVTGDPFGILADRQLAGLTSPVAYVTPAAFVDPFGLIRSQAFSFSRELLLDGDFPFPELPNPKRSFLYFHYPSFAAMMGVDGLNARASSVISLGPDREDSFGLYATFPPEVFPPLAVQAGYLRPVDTLYDPTNGTGSPGDMPRFVGDVPNPLR